MIRESFLIPELIIRDFKSSEVQFCAALREYRSIVVLFESKFPVYTQTSHKTGIKNNPVTQI